MYVTKRYNVTLNWHLKSEIKNIKDWDIDSSTGLSVLKQEKLGYSQTKVDKMRFSILHLAKYI